MGAPSFWSRFCDIPDIVIDTASIVRTWREAREAVAAVLTAKQSTPLERITMPGRVREVVAAYDSHRQAIALLNQALQQINADIGVVKEKAASGNPEALSTGLAQLIAVKARHTPPTTDLCAAYLAEKDAKAATEGRRDQAKADLDQYRTGIFPAYQTAINIYLGKFNAGFRLDAIDYTNSRGGPACTYNVIINNIPVSVLGAAPAPGEPSFRNTLSAGDRNTLALAFFFASLDQDAQLADKIVVIDDPMSSLDEHRTLTTVQEVRRLAGRAGQVIVFSHSKQFLCQIWEGADSLSRASLRISRSGAGSAIHSWDVAQDSITEHDRRHAMLHEYLAGSSHNNREVAHSIRLLLEGFLRVACPEHFPPGCMLGQFRDSCDKKVGRADQILDINSIQELRDLTEYANRFHHDTNAAWQTESINDGELANCGPIVVRAPTCDFWIRYVSGTSPCSPSKLRRSVPGPRPIVASTSSMQ